ncbi:hypothetical protein D9M68_998120 [compost metagenome]
MPMCRRTSLISTLGSVTSKPSTVTWPPVMSSSLFRQRRKVDFPEPDGPITQTTSPSATSALMPLSTWLEPKDFVSSLTEILLGAVSAVLIC